MPTKRNISSQRTPPDGAKRVLALVRLKGILRARDLQSQGLPREYLSRLVKQGQLKRVGRGLYQLLDAKISEHHSLTQVAKRVPGAVICLLSALRFHGFTTQSPTQVWVALGSKARRPTAPDLPLRIVRFSGLALTQGTKTHQLEGVPVRITTPAKTVADCFKYRHKIGLDVALEALREGWRERRFTMDELWQMGRVCRVANVMRPYLEAIT